MNKHSVQMVSDSSLNSKRLQKLGMQCVDYCSVKERNRFYLPSFQRRNDIVVSKDVRGNCRNFICVPMEAVLDIRIYLYGICHVCTHHNISISFVILCKHSHFNDNNQIPRLQTIIPRVCSYTSTSCEKISIDSYPV